MFTQRFNVIVSALQVVELISSAIGDVVQGIYNENTSNTEVKHRLYVEARTKPNRLHTVGLCQSFGCSS